MTPEMPFHPDPRHEIRATFESSSINIMSKHFDKWAAATLTPLKKNSYKAGMTQRVYGEAPGVRSSTLKFTRPKHMRHSIEHPLEPTYALTLGEATHIYLLEPKRFDLKTGIEEYFQYCVTEGLDTQKAKAQRLADPERPLVNEGLIEKARRLGQAVLANDLARSLVKVKCDTELSGFAWNDDSQIIQKIRLDLYPVGGNYLVDFKNVQDLDDGELWKTIKFRNYHVSAALQLDTDAMITGKPRPLYYLICMTGPTGKSETPDDGPYDCRVVEIATAQGEPSLVDEGRILYKERLNKFANAARTNCWEGWEKDDALYLKAKPPWSNFQ